ncbi:MAG: response regulator [Candidatus Cloacimonetes bacterium]|nr:response regulator [Candidatus Cloacimonadota bacterium]
MNHPKYKNAKILIVDDEAIFCTMIKEVFKPYGFIIESSTQYEHALDLFDKSKHALVLCDFNLAGSSKNGLDIVREFKKKSELTQIIMITGRPSLELAVKAFETGIYDFMVKPVNMRHLKQKVDSALNQYHLLLQEEELKRDLKEKNSQLKKINHQLRDALDESKKYQAHLAHSTKLAGVGEMTASIAHEFNNILGAIRGYSQLAIRSASDTDYLLDAHKKNKKAADKAIKVVSNLLQFSKKLNPSMEINDINVAITETITLSLHHLNLQKIQVETKLDETPNFEFDSGQLQQVFLNLITNACQAMNNGGDLQIVNSYHDNQVKLNFIDTGSGISPKNLEKIFLPFFSTKGGDNGAIGSGLGLFVSKQIIESHGGKISVSSTNKGTNFEIVLPCNGLELPEEGVVVNEPCEPSPIRAIVVDDEKDICEVLCQFLIAKDVAATSAYTGKECLNLLEQDSNIDLILMDLNMPEINGDEALHVIKEKYPNIIVYIMSGYGTKQKIDGVLSIGADRYISKPFDLDTLDRYIDEEIETIKERKLLELS